MQGFLGESYNYLCSGLLSVGSALLLVVLEGSLQSEWLYSDFTTPHRSIAACQAAPSGGSGALRALPFFCSPATITGPSARKCQQLGLNTSPLLARLLGAIHSPCPWIQTACTCLATVLAVGWDCRLKTLTCQGECPVPLTSQSEGASRTTISC